jgi:lysophospholipase L1-like esterase
MTDNSAQPLEISEPEGSTAQSSPRHRVVFTLLALVISLVVMLITAELAVRLVIDNGMQYDLEMWKYARDVKVISEDPLIAHEHGANRHARLMGVDVQTNSHGLRDREYPVERVPGTLRIVMLGDSFTEGWGVPLEDTFSKRIEHLYADRGVTAEVMNAGIGNYNTIQEVEYFLKRMTPYNPDIVVLNYFVNDAEPVPHDTLPSFIGRHCYSCVFFVGRLDSLLRRLSDRSDWADYYLGLYGDGHSKGWLDAKAAIERLAEYCKEHNIKLLIASLPELHDVQHYRFNRITALVRDAAAGNGVQFVDLLPYLQGEPSSRLWVTPPDPHPNAYANQFLAKGIFEALVKLQ